MRDFGIVRPGTTLYIPFATYDSNDPSASVTLTGLATTDIEIYRDGSTTQRSSDNGFTLLDTDGIDFDSITGIHGISINLADNSDAGFYRAGSQYTVVVASVTVDAGTINFIAATFRIGQPAAILNTTIATLATQTSFTLTDGPAEDDALNGMWAVIHDVASAVQFSRVLIADYTGSTKTVTLVAGATFTAAASDNFAVMDMAPMQPATLGRQPIVDAAGLVDANVVKAGPTGAGVVWPANLTTRFVTMFDTDYSNLYDSTNKAFKATLGNWAQGGAAMVFTFERMVGASTTSGQPALKLTGASSGSANGAEIFGGEGGTGLRLLGDAAGIESDGGTAGIMANSISVDTNVVVNGNMSISGATTFVGAITATDAANDVRGVKLASDGLAAVTTWTVNITGSLSGSVGSVTGSVGSVTGSVGSVTGSVTLSAGSVDAIWDEDIVAAHTTADTAGKKLATAGGAADPWDTALPGAYATGKAGYILGTNLDAVLSARTLASAAYFDPATDTVANVTTVGSVTGAVGSVTGNVGGSVASVTSGVTVTTNNDKTGYALSSSGLNLQTAWTVNITGNLSGSVGSVTGSVGSVTGSVGSVTGSVTISAGSVDAIWDEDIVAAHTTADTAGKKLASAGSVSDPWDVTLPGTYAAGKAGYILGTNLDAVLSARTLASASYFDPATDTVANVTTVGSVTGAVGSVTGAVGSVTAGVTLAASQHVIVDSGTVTTVTNQLTAAQIATGVWQDTTAGDFTVISSIGKSLYTSGVVPGGAGGLFIAGSNSATTVDFTGNLSGSVGSVTGSVGSVAGAVGSVTGNVGGNVTGSVGSVVTKTGYSLASTGLDLVTAWTVNLTGNLSGSVGSVTGAVGSVTGAVGSISGVTFPTNFGDLAITVTTGRVTVGTNADKSGYSLTSGTGLGNQTADITGNLSGSVGSVTGNVGGNVTGSVGSVVGAVGSVTGAVGSVTAAVTITAGSVDLIWDETTVGHTTAGTTGKALTDASSAGDPWSTALPGAYAAGSAGYILGNGVTLSAGGLSAITSWTVNITGSMSGSVGSVTGAVGSVTGNVGGNVNGNVTGSTGSVVGAVGSVTGGVGGDLAGSVLGNVSGSVGSVTGSVGSVTGSVGSVTGNVGGSVASVTGAVGSVAGNVSGDVAGKVLGGGSGTITGDGVRASSVTGATGSVTGSVGSVVGFTPSNITTILTTTNKLETGLVLDGAVYQFTANMLELAPSGGGSAPTAAQVADAVWDELLSGHAISGSAGAALTTAAGVGAGSGARTVTITVNDGATALQNAIVRLIEGVNAYRVTTNVSGVAVFNLDDATYTVSITKSGYTYSGASLVVSATVAQTYSMTAIAITPGTGDFTTGFLVAYDETGTLEPGALIYCELTKAPVSDTGFSYDSSIRTLTAAASTALVEIPGLVKGATYRIWRGQRIAAATNNIFLIPTSAGSTYELPTHIGRE